MSFENKVILITGAGSGIGAETARHLAKLGGSISLVDCNEKGLKEVVDQIKNVGSPTPLGVVADISTDAERIIDETIKHFGKLNVLVNCAGVGVLTPILDANMDEFDRIMNINVRSIIVLTKLAVPHLEKTKGNIVNVSSIAGKIVFKGAPFYCMSKAALDQFTMSSALEFGPRKIRVNSVNPGVINTPFYKQCGISNEIKEQMMNDYAERTPVGRCGETSDIAAAIAYLASDSTSFITGTQLRVDGGAVIAGAF